MHPLLFQIGPVPVHTYGFLIALGFILALSVIRRLAERAKLNAEKVLDLTFWSLLVGFLGCRVLFIITRWEYFSTDPLAMFKLWEGGLVFLGGPIAVFPFVLWQTRKHRLPLWKVMDVLIPGLVLGHMFGRFGCFAAGCCYGKPTDAPWGVRFQSDLVDAAMRGIPLHPTQLYEAFSLGILFVGLLFVSRIKKFDGQVVLTYFMVYPIIRSIIEVYRGDAIRGFVIDGILSTSQFLSGLVFIAAVLGLSYRLRQVQRPASRA